jgi:hypothetical protein
MVLCTILCFYLFLFSKLFILEHELLSGVYIGFINFWTSVVDHVYRTLETFSLVFFMVIFMEP